MPYSYRFENVVVKLLSCFLSLVVVFLIPITNNQRQLKAQALQDSLKRQHFAPSALVGTELGCHTLPADSI